MLNRQAIKIKKNILIAGPTASGKSALALKIAEMIPVQIINTDSMQIYSKLSIVTARPEPCFLKKAPHLLYGYVCPTHVYSVALWERDVRQFYTQQKLVQSSPVFVGGTGLYFKALEEGISVIPDVQLDIRKKWRALLSEEGAHFLYKKLKEVDPDSATRIAETDGQRIVRALEVQESTGQSLTYWHKKRRKPVLKSDDTVRILFVPSFDTLDQRIEKRIYRMIDDGVVDEIAEFLKLGLNPELPVMKVIGVKEFSEMLYGKITLREAILTVLYKTRQYAKRQMTWFRNQFKNSWYCIDDLNRIDTKQLRKWID